MSETSLALVFTQHNKIPNKSFRHDLGFNSSLESRGRAEIVPAKSSAESVHPVQSVRVPVSRRAIAHAPLLKKNGTLIRSLRPRPPSHVAPMLWLLLHWLLFHHLIHQRLGLMQTAAQVLDLLLESSDALVAHCTGWTRRSRVRAGFDVARAGFDDWRAQAR